MRVAHRSLLRLTRVLFNLLVDSTVHLHTFPQMFPLPWRIGYQHPHCSHMNVFQRKQRDPCYKPLTHTIRWHVSPSSQCISKSIPLHSVPWSIYTKGHAAIKTGWNKYKHVHVLLLVVIPEDCHFKIAHNQMASTWSTRSCIRHPLSSQLSSRMFRSWGCEQLGTKEDKRAEIEPGINKLENLPPLSSNANHLLFKGDLATFLDNFNEYKHDTVQDVVTLFPFFGKWGYAGAQNLYSVTTTTMTTLRCWGWKHRLIPVLKQLCTCHDF